MTSNLRYDRRMTGRISLASLLGGEGCLPSFVSALPANSFCVFSLPTHSGTSGWANGRPPLSQGWRLRADSTGTRKTIAVEQAS